MKLAIFAIVAGACLLSACASQPAPVLEVVHDPAIEVSYAGEVGTGNLPQPTALPATAEPESAEGRVILQVNTKFIRLSAEAAEALLGKGAGTVAATSLSDAGVEEWLDAFKGRKDAEVVSSPIVQMWDGARSNIVIANQVSYISAFELAGSGTQRIADPVVNTMTEGLMLELHATSTDGGTNLHLKLTMAELQRPIATQNVRVFGSIVTVQTPVMLTQSLTAQGTCAEGHSLMLTGMVGQEGEVIVVLVQAHKVEPKGKGD